jgi:hypothetical protein
MTAPGSPGTKSTGPVGCTGVGAPGGGSDVGGADGCAGGTTGISWVDG